MLSSVFFEEGILRFAQGQIKEEPNDRIKFRITTPFVIPRGSIPRGISQKKEGDSSLTLRMTPSFVTLFFFCHPFSLFSVTLRRKPKGLLKKYEKNFSKNIFLSKKANFLPYGEG